MLPPLLAELVRTPSTLLDSAETENNWHYLPTTTNHHLRCEQPRCRAHNLCSATQELPSSPPRSNRCILRQPLSLAGPLLSDAGVIATTVSHGNRRRRAWLHLVRERASEGWWRRSGLWGSLPNPSNLSSTRGWRSDIKLIQCTAKLVHVVRLVACTHRKNIMEHVVCDGNYIIPDNFLCDDFFFWWIFCVMMNYDNFMYNIFSIIYIYNLFYESVKSKLVK